jgi:hypothetical protein
MMMLVMRVGMIMAKHDLVPTIDFGYDGFHRSHWDLFDNRSTSTLLSFTVSRQRMLSWPPTFPCNVAGVCGYVVGVVHGSSQDACSACPGDCRDGNLRLHLSLRGDG